MPAQSEETTSCYRVETPILCILPGAGTRGVCRTAGNQDEGCCGTVPSHHTATALGLHMAVTGAGCQHSLPARVA